MVSGETLGHDLCATPVCFLLCRFERRVGLPAILKREREVAARNLQICSSGESDPLLIFCLAVDLGCSWRIQVDPVARMVVLSGVFVGIRLLCLVRRLRLSL